jgi:hypothetical protein
MRKDPLEYFQALGLNPGAGPVEIRRAYRQMVRRWHPDLFKPGSPMQTTAEDVTKEINEAYEHLYRKRLYRKFMDKSAPVPEPPPEAGVDSPPEGPEPGSKAARGGPWWPFGRRRREGPRDPGGKAPGRRGRRWAAVAAGLAGLGLLASALPRLLDVASQWAMAAPPTARAAQAPAGPGPAAVAAEPGSPGTAPAPEQAPSHPRAARPAAQTSEPGIPERTLRSLGAAESPGPAEETALFQGAGAGPALPLNAWIERPVAPGFGAAAAAGVDGDPTAPGLLARAENLLEVFGVGDTRSRVIAVQGKPDEAGVGVLRYGASVVYLDGGYVSGWTNRYPRLRVRSWPSFEAAALDRFEPGSSREAVVRAQGLPEAFTLLTYSYGTSTIFFDNGLVRSWTEGDVPLHSLEEPVLGFRDPAAAPGP